MSKRRGPRGGVAAAFSVGHRRAAAFDAQRQWPSFSLSSRDVIPKLLRSIADHFSADSDTGDPWSILGCASSGNQ